MKTITEEQIEAARRGVELLTRDRDCMVECNSTLEQAGDGYKPVPGTLDPDCADDFRDYSAAIEEIPALLSALEAAIERVEKLEGALKNIDRMTYGTDGDLRKMIRDRTHAALKVRNDGQG